MKYPVKHKINKSILAKEVRIIGDGITSRICSIEEARQIAFERSMDLIEINSTIVPILCRVCDYKKFLYELKQRDKEKKKNQVQSETKELRLTPTTDEHDLAFKTKHAEHWLREGNRVRAVVVFRGREMLFKNQGHDILARLAKNLEEVGKIELAPKMEGKRMFSVIVPK